MIFLLCYLFGIFMGLYFKNIASFVLFEIIGLMVIYKKNKDYKKAIIIFIFATNIAFFRSRYEVAKYDSIKELTQFGGRAVVVDELSSTQYKNVYLIKVKNIKYKLYINKKINLRCGEQIYVEGDVALAQEQRNEYGFNYREYLKQKNIGGNIFATSIKVVNDDWNIYKINRVKLRFRRFIKSSFSYNAFGFINGILLADDSNIDDSIKELFKNTSLLHILAVSGMHINILETIIKRLLEKLKIHKNISQIIIIIALISYMLLIRSPISCVRAVLMESIICIGFILRRKNDFKNSILISLAIICFMNPYNLFSIGLWLSYLGTIGIVYISPYINKKICKLVKKQNKVIKNLSISIGVQVLIIPILIYNYNTISAITIISNLIVTPFIEPIVYFICIACILKIIHISIFTYLVNYCIEILYRVLGIIEKFDFLKLYIARPHIIIIFLYYFFLVLIIIKLESDFIRAYRFLLKIRKKVLLLLLISTLIFNSIIIIPNNYLEYDFIDVGQGDCSLIITPKGKTILIDGGDNQNYDNGEKTILPILINKRIKQIDYLIISHFDSDHVGGLFTIMEKYRIKQIIISKQVESSDNFKEFMNIIKVRKINIKGITKGDKIIVEKDVSMLFLWPSNKLITENGLNNNSIVCKLIYGSTSILFTGDIEAIAEKKIIEEYKDNLQVLNSTILKVAHHGSKTSSIQEFIEAVGPKIVMIGVGKDNKFGHPDSNIIDEFSKRKIRICRTDNNGQIKIKINKDQILKIKEFIHE